MRNYSFKVILQQLRWVSLQHTNVIHLVAKGTSEAHGHVTLQTKTDFRHTVRVLRWLRHDQYFCSLTQSSASAANLRAEQG